ncbi:HAD family hydrolase, partial [Chitinophaga sp.]|uniref:HAD family hydrolase n=2 Tax=Chitinophaga TaxID=79328 RepID=UPI002FDCE9D1
MKQAIAFFDFDGTITRKDTLFEIIRFQKGAAALYAGMAVLSPLLVLFKLKMISNQRMKEIVLRFYFKNTSLAVFQERCDAFCRERLPSLLRPRAVNAIARPRYAPVLRRLHWLMALLILAAYLLIEQRG